MEKKITKNSKSEKKSFKEYLAKIESPDYPWVAKDCPENPTALEKTKFKLCQKMLVYQQDNNLSDEKIAKRIGLNKDKTLQILFCWIDKFSLDDLLTYTEKLLAPKKLEITVREKVTHARTA